MTEQTPDRWAAADAYERYMARWSRLIAEEFVAGLGVSNSSHWLELGCGTGALTQVVCAACKPASIVACDPSAAFVAHARSALQDARASFVVASVDSLPTRSGGFDAIVSGLVLTFVPDSNAALRAMCERVRPGGVVAAYIWDYTGGLEFLSHFWAAAASTDATAAALDESRRFGEWQPLKLKSLFESAGLVRVECTTLEVETVFADFADFWQPFLGGTGPAPAYVAALDAARRAELEQRLRELLTPAADGSIALRARAFAVRGVRIVD